MTIDDAVGNLNELAWLVYSGEAITLLAWFIGLVMFIAIIKGTGVILRR